MIFPFIFPHFIFTQESTLITIILVSMNCIFLSIYDNKVITRTPLCISLHIGLHINNNTPAGQHTVFMHVNHRSHSGVVFEISFIFYCVRWVITSCKFHFICISRVHSCVFHVHLGCNFLDLELQKWPDFLFRDVVVFFFDRDCIIVDRELQGPS